MHESKPIPTKPHYITTLDDPMPALLSLPQLIQLGVRPRQLKLRRRGPVLGLLPRPLEPHRAAAFLVQLILQVVQLALGVSAATYGHAERRTHLEVHARLVGLCLLGPKMIHRPRQLAHVRRGPLEDDALALFAGAVRIWQKQRQLVDPDIDVFPPAALDLFLPVSLLVQAHGERVART